MNCHDARQQFSALIAGKVGLTEWAQVDAHVSECTECGDLLEKLYRLSPRQDPARRRTLVVSVDAYLDPSDATDLIVQPRRRRRGPTLLLILVTAAIGLGLGAGLAFYNPAWSPKTLISILKTGPRLAPNATSPEITSPPSPSLSPRTTQSAPDVQTSNPNRGNEARSAASKLAPAPDLPSSIKPERKELPPPKGAATASPEKPKPASEPSSQAEISGSDVVVQLSVQDRGEAERDITKLLARLGGTKLGRDRGSTLTVAIPRSSYSEFARDLAQIGPSQMETLRESLPDPVRMVVKLAK
jgi:hypothetical protein